MSSSSISGPSFSADKEVAAAKPKIAAASPTTGVASSPERTAKRIRTQKTYYAVKKGKDVRSCIFLSWDTCRDQVEGCKSAVYGMFSDWEHAEAFLEVSGALSSQNYATKFGCDLPAARQLRNDDKAEALPASPPRKKILAVTSPSSPYSFVKSLNRTNQKRPAPASDVAAVAQLKDSSEEWQLESLDTKPPSDHWWEIYFFLNNYKKRFKTMILEKEKVEQLWNSEGCENTFSLRNFWTWCRTNIDGYKRLTAEQRQNSLKVKRLCDLGFDLKMESSSTMDMIEEGLQDSCRGDLISNRQAAPQKSLSPSRNKKSRSDNSAKRTWEKMFEQLLDYRQAHNTFNVPAETSNEEDSKLRKWIQTQRLTYQKIKDGKDRGVRNRALTEKKIRELQALGFPFDGPLDSDNQKLRLRKPHKRWEEMLEKLKCHYEKTKSFDIDPAGSSDEESSKAKKDLRTWLAEQNTQYAAMREGKRSAISEEKIQRLRDIGYQLEYVTFVERVEQLKAFIEEHGKSEIPKTHDLFKWTRKMRLQLQRHEEGKQGVQLTAEQLQQLKNLNFFVTTVRKPISVEEEDRKWDEMFEKLKEYKKENGDCLISTSNFSDPLVKWVMAQRRYYRSLKDKGKSSKLDARKLQLLHDIGFIFRQKSNYKTFEERLEELRAFKEQHGHLRIPTNIPGSGAFVAHCRDQFRLAKQGKKHSMSEEKFEQLRSLGFEFQVGKSPVKNFPRHTWEERFQQLLSFKAEFGHTVVPQHFRGHNNLGQWVKAQRENYRLLRRGKRSGMTSEMALRLNDLGFVWDVSQNKRKREAQGKEVSDVEEHSRQDLRPPPNHPRCLSNNPARPDTALLLAMRRSKEADNPKMMGRSTDNGYDSSSEDENDQSTRARFYFGR